MSNERGVVISAGEIDNEMFEELEQYPNYINFNFTTDRQKPVPLDLSSKITTIDKGEVKKTCSGCDMFEEFSSKQEAFNKTVEEHNNNRTKYLDEKEEFSKKTRTIEEYEKDIEKLREKQLTININQSKVIFTFMIMLLYCVLLLLLIFQDIIPEQFDIYVKVFIAIFPIMVLIGLETCFWAIRKAKNFGGD